MRYANNASLAHAWAHAQSTEGRGSNMYFEVDTIFSYGSHFPMAVINRQTKVVLMTTNSYSNTTSKHMHHMSRAVPLDYRRYYVPIVQANRKAEHKQNYQAMLERYDRQLLKASRARTRTDFYLRTASELLVDINDYTKHFKLGYRVKSADVNLDEYKARALAQSKKERIEREAREKQALIDMREQIKEWRGGGCVGCQSFYNVPVMLRVMPVNPRANEPLHIVETSRGANFPASHAPLAWRIISRCVERGEGWAANGHTIKLGMYNVQSISAKGELVAGCHRIAYAELKHCAKLLGLI